MKEPKILYFDIETLFNVVAVFGLGKQYVGYESILKEKKVLCISYMWEHEQKSSKNPVVHTLYYNMNKQDYDIRNMDTDSDKQLLINFVKIYEQADQAIAHNGISFDYGTILARMAKHGLKPIAPVILDDTYRSSKHIRFNCHRLDYLARYFNLGKKADHNYDLWLKVSKGDRKALLKMGNYCAQDVILLRKVYKKLQPYIKSKFNQAVYYNNPVLCPSCGGKTVKYGTRMTTTLGLRQVYFCVKCGKKHTSGVNLMKDTKNYLR